MSDQLNNTESLDISESTVELIDDFTLPTESKAPAASQPSPQPATTLQPTPTAPVSTPAESASFAEPVAITPEVVKPKATLTPDTQAELLIGSLDFTQAMVLSPIIKKRLKRKLGEDYEQAILLFEQLDSSAREKKDLTEDELRWYIRAYDLWKTREEINFTDDEVKQLKEPLMKIIVDAGYNIPPSVGIIMAVSEVMAPRIVSTFLD